MISDFEPRVEVGSEYKASDGEIYRVKDFLCNLGNIPDTVVFVNIKDESVEYEAGFEDWNTRQFKRVSSASINDGGVKNRGEASPQDDDNQIQTKTTSDTPQDDSRSEPRPSSKTPDGKYSSDPKINELAGLLDAGPNRFNQRFYPVDDTLPENNMVEKEVEEAFQQTLDEISEIRTKGRERRSNWLNEMLWTCAGADKELLRMCPIDWAKKAGMGGTILGTAVLATLSMAFAVFSVAFASLNTWAWLPAIIIGFIWGLVIFNLDRYLVNSMFSDGESTISWQELKSGLPRIIIAIFLGVVISTPLEMMIFKSKIEEYMITKDEAKLDKDALLRTSPTLRSLQEDLDKQNSIVDKYFADWQRKDSLYNIEHTQGQNGSKAGYGPKAKQLEKDKNDAKKLYDDELIIKNSIKQEYDQVYASVVAAQNNNISVQQGFSRRLEILLEITAWNGGKNSLFWVRIMIMLMFVTLEVLPVFNKMMQQDGRYDKLVDLESDTMDRLTRVKEYNNINVLRTGYLGIYGREIIGHEIKEDESHNEGSNAFLKKDRKRENREETEQNNQIIYRKGLLESTNYVMAQIEAIFRGTYSKELTDNQTPNISSKRAINVNISKDASDEAETIKG